MYRITPFVVLETGVPRRRADYVAQWTQALSSSRRARRISPGLSVLVRVFSKTMIRKCALVLQTLLLCGVGLDIAEAEGFEVYNAGIL